MQKDRCSMQLTNLLRSPVLFSNLRVHNVESLSMSELKNLEDSKSCRKCLWFGLEHCLGTDALNVIRTRLRWAANISTFQSKNIMANGMQIATMLRNFQHHEELLLANGNICEAKLTESWFVALLVLLCITRWQKKKINKNVKQQNRKKNTKNHWITEYQKNPTKTKEAARWWVHEPLPIVEFGHLQTPIFLSKKSQMKFTTRYLDFFLFSWTLTRLQRHKLPSMYFLD